MGKISGAAALGVVLGSIVPAGSLAAGSLRQRTAAGRPAPARSGVARTATASGVSRMAAGLARRFRVTYAGSGSYRTVYLSEPPNQGAKPDHNFVYDSSSQRWSLTFAQLLDLGRPRSLTVAAGPASIVAKIDHVHVDGIYAFYDRTVRCRLRSGTSGSFPVTLAVRSLRAPHALAITVANPVSEALLRLPSECPEQVDPIDGLRDNYLEPGFSFAPGYGADRWFRATAVVPLVELRHVAQIALHFHDTRAGRPPKRCAVEHTAWEQCQTSGNWTGTLLLQRIGG